MVNIPTSNPRSHSSYILCSYSHNPTTFSSQFDGKLWVAFRTLSDKRRRPEEEKLDISVLESGLRYLDIMAGSWHLEKVSGISQFQSLACLTSAQDGTIHKIEIQVIPDTVERGGSVIYRLYMSRCQSSNTRKRKGSVSSDGSGPSGSRAAVKKQEIK